MQQGLKEALVTLGEVDHALDDVIGLLQQTESDIQEMDNVFGDPKYIEIHLKKLQVGPFLMTSRTFLVTPSILRNYKWDILVRPSTLRNYK